MDLGHQWLREYVGYCLVTNLVVAGALEFAYRRGLVGVTRRIKLPEFDELPTVKRHITWG